MFRETRVKPWAAAAAALGVGGLLASAGLAQASPTTSHHASATIAPGSSAGELRTVAAVPHSTDAWTTGDDGKYFVAVRHDGRWTTVPRPRLGRSGDLTDIAVGSSSAVWAVGARSTGAPQLHGQDDVPVIARWTGKKFVNQPLPAVASDELFADGHGTLESISASSATNAWAVGDDIVRNQPGTQDQFFVAFHWNGKKWSTVPTPDGLSDVSTSSPTNAWGTSDAGALYRWNGATWSAAAGVPSGAMLTGVATSSPSLTYAVGSVGGQPAILKYNGASWSSAPIAMTLSPGDTFVSITIHGAAAWAIDEHQTAKGRTRSVILHTTGATWTTQQVLGAHHQLADVAAASAQRADAVGTIVAKSFAETRLFEVFNGSSWQAKPTRPN